MCVLKVGDEAFRDLNKKSRMVYPQSQQHAAAFLRSKKPAAPPPSPFIVQYKPSSNFCFALASMSAVPMVREVKVVVRGATIVNSRHHPKLEVNFLR